MAINNFNRFKARGAEIIRDPAGAALDIRLVFALALTLECARVRKAPPNAGRDDFDKFSKFIRALGG